MTANEQQEIWGDRIPKNQRMLRMFQSSLSVLLCATLGGVSMQVKYFTLFGDNFFPLCSISKPSSLFKKQEAKNPQEFSISSPLLPFVTAYWSSKQGLHFSFNTNTYLCSFKWRWIFWLAGFLFPFYKEKDMGAVKLHTNTDQTHIHCSHEYSR